MVQSGAWFENVFYWWVKAFLVDPPLFAIGMFLSIFGEWGFALQSNIDATGMLKYPDLNNVYAGRWRGSGKQKGYEVIPDFDANFKYAFDEITDGKGTGGLISVE